ncbi:hypothetical protein [Roseomonas chloroacetimidivorans]|jgi:hypothetical protein|uniref:hypothetical protein n=1 Tax=Roseomonas chloroacetimidivorans TaxID=1766656 RepID=UPI003C7179E7
MPPAVSRAAAVTFVTAVGLGIAFWPQFSTGFFHFTSDRLDGLIAAAIHEHWYAFFTGTAEAWNKVFYFHPWPNTLAMNDGYLLHGILHAALRAAGLPPLLSADIAGIILKAMIAPAIYLIARRHLAMPVAAALLAALLAISAGNLLLATAHAQFFAVGPATICGLLTLEASAALRAGQPRRALATGVPAAILAGLLLMTSFYVTYVMLAVIALALFLDLVLRALARQPVLPSGHSWIAPTLVIALVGAVSFVPALILYIPQIRAGGLHDVNNAMAYAMTPDGLLDPGIRSPLWAWTNPGPTTTPDGPHGYGPLVLIATLLGTATAIWRAFRPGPHQAAARHIAAFGIVVLGLLLLITNWWGHWAWLQVWKTVPGMGAFRVVSRWSLLVSPVVMLIVTWWLATLGPRLGRILPALLGALLLAEQLVPAYRGADRRAEEARLTAIPPPPADCRVFIATRPREGVVRDYVLGIYSHNVDAMMAASVLRLPTINGFSTFNPSGWDLADPSSRIYPERAMAEAARHNLTPCGLNFESLRWSPTGRPFEGVPPLPRTLPLERNTLIAVNASTPAVRDVLGTGWSVLEGTGIWTLGARAHMLIPIPEDMKDGTLRLQGVGFARGTPYQDVQPVLRSGAKPEQRIPLQGNGTIEIPFTSDDLQDGLLDVVLVIKAPAAPADPGQSGDHRVLGFFLRSIQVL